MDGWGWDGWVGGVLAGSLDMNRLHVKTHQKRPCPIVQTAWNAGKVSIFVSRKALRVAPMPVEMHHLCRLEAPLTVNMERLSYPCFVDVR